MPNIQISNISIGDNHPPKIIAELSANHNGSIEKAKLLITKASQSGAHFVKLQTYTPDTLTINCNRPEYKIKGGLWDGYTLYQLYSEACTPFEWHEELFKHAKKEQIVIFSTPFDETAVDLLESLNCPAYKIASFELIDVHLLRYIATTCKPIIMSTGMASLKEIKESVDTVLSAGCKELVLLHCISSYPTPINQANLLNIKTLKKAFPGLIIGLSDHTLGNITAITATTLGASIIEKHFTLSRYDRGPDSDFSTEPQELQSLITDLADCWSCLGTQKFTRPHIEVHNKIFRRSLIFVKEVKCGDIITKSHVKSIRPGFGLPPKYFDSIIGKTAKRDIERGEPVKWSLIK